MILTDLYFFASEDVCLNYKDIRLYTQLPNLPCQDEPRLVIGFKSESLEAKKHNMQITKVEIR